MKKFLAPIIVLMVLLTCCATSDDVEYLDNRIEGLNFRVSKLEAVQSAQSQAIEDLRTDTDAKLDALFKKSVQK